jgi:glycosyltransferase involved in cell wall biosynthesis
MADIPVCYTEFGKRVSVKHDPKLKNMDVIYHGTDKNLYKPWPKEMKASMRESFWGKGFDKKFIILNVNRNQPRKDLNRTLCVFAEVKKHIPEAFLFMLSNPADIGGNLIDMGLQLGLKWGVDFMTPDPTKYNPMVGIPEDQIVTMYNTADVCISTTLGEGWGLSLTEAMACGCPVIFPDNTSITEIIGKTSEEFGEIGVRGSLIESGELGNRICLGPQDNNLSRPLTSVKEMVKEIFLLHGNINEETNLFSSRVKNGIKWVPSWDKVGEQWRDIFNQACEILDQRNGE